MIISGRIEGGKFSNLPHLLRSFKQFEDRRVTITIAPLKQKWTDQQRKYLFGAVYPFVAELLECSPEEARTGLKGLYLFRRQGFMKLHRSEKDLSIEEYAEYLDRIDVFCVDQFGVNIPEPEK